MRSSNSTMVKKGHTSFLLERATVSLLSKSAVENLKKKSQSNVVRLKKRHTSFLVFAVSVSLLSRSAVEILEAPSLPMAHHSNCSLPSMENWPGGARISFSVTDAGNVFARPLRSRLRRRPSYGIEAGIWIFRVVVSRIHSPPPHPIHVFVRC